ncbi:sensor histidine kinase [Actinomadura kijaniata]|uniref:sensor histidine kinase n=1 Tax=Actinomadura kijaniata TaxID=46161 RepID=UPI000836BA8C|nr:sensor histidine kinase [Actinomadura kijaniata]
MTTLWDRVTRRLRGPDAAGTAAGTTPGTPADSPGGPGRGRTGAVTAAVDVTLAVVLAIVVLATSANAQRLTDRDLWPGGVVLILLGTLIMAVRRRHPVITLVVLTLVVPLYYPLGYPDGPLGVVFFAALFNAAVHCRPAVPLGAVIVINAAIPLVAFLKRDGNGALVDGPAVAFLTATLLLLSALGMYVRNRRARVLAAEARAAAAERDREEQAQRRATEERLRIARELHDVLAHQISLINVQAGAALHRRDDPERAYEALATIKAASKQTLRELRGVLGVLRQLDQNDTEPVTPAPTLDRLQDLADQTTAAGLHVDLHTHDDTGTSTGTGTDSGTGSGASVPAPVALAGYRIVQEALTNALRHSGARTATVTVHHTGDAVTLRIDDDGTGPTDPAALDRGNGLRGMAERAATVGGRLTAGPRPGGGFRVHARLPLTDPADPAAPDLPPAELLEHDPGKDHQT